MEMKRILFTAIIILCVIFSASAYDNLFDGSAGGLPILGFMDGYYMITVDPIVNTGEGSLDLYIGMPFNLLGEDVSFKDFPLGRTIAYWSLVVNLKGNRYWRVGIHATNLKYDETEIGYYLIFLTDHEGSGDDYWVVHSTSDDSHYDYFPSADGSLDNVASINNQIRFMLDSNSNAVKESFQESYDYRATVTIILEGS